MRKPIKTCIIVDPIGAAGQGPEEEVENHIKVYTEMIHPAPMSPYTALYPDEGSKGIQPGTKLLIYDFGGMVGANDLMDSNARALIRWAENNPKALVIVASGFTYRNFVQVALDDEELKLINVVVDDGHQEDPIPAWWRLEHDLPVPDPEKVYEAQMAAYGSPAPTAEELEAERRAEDELEAAKQERLRVLQADQERKDAEQAAARKKHEEPIGYITIPVRLDGKPGDSVFHSRFKVSDCMIDVTDDGTGKDIAHFGGAFGGTYECNFPDGKGSLWGYSISPYAFWEAFKKLHEEFSGQKLPDVGR